MDGSTKKDTRVRIYIRELNTDDKLSACRYLIKRAKELEKLLLIGEIPNQRIFIA